MLFALRLALHTPENIFLDFLVKSLDAFRSKACTTYSLPTFNPGNLNWQISNFTFDCIVPTSRSTFFCPKTIFKASKYCISKAFQESCLKYKITEHAFKARSFNHDETMSPISCIRLFNTTLLLLVKRDDSLADPGVLPDHVSGLLPSGTPPCGHHPSWHSRDQAHPRHRYTADTTDYPGLPPAGTPPRGHHPSWHSRDQAHPRHRYTADTMDYPGLLPAGPPPRGHPSILALQRPSSS
jgi:hypothetical protein